MKRTVQIACIIIALLCIYHTGECYAQAALQEIVKFQLPGTDRTMSRIGAGGDINGDGRPDLVFGFWTPNPMVTDADSIYIYHSIPDSTGVPDQILTRPSWLSGGFGYNLSYAGDLNGDGIDDLVVGIRYYGPIHPGAVAIYWGGETLSAEPDVFIDALPFGHTQSWDLGFGSKIITHCDVNGDGINDLLVYADGPQWENWGNVYVFLGGTPFNTTPALHIRGSRICEYLGAFMDAGDINGDGFDDIVVCSYGLYPPPPDATEGYYFDLKIFAGSDSLSSLPIYESRVAGDDSKSSISALIANGDLNGDGKSDVVMQYWSALGPQLKIIYGQAEWSELREIEVDFNLSSAFRLYSYCKLTDDPYDDLLIYSNYLPGTTENYSCTCVLEQTGPTLDLSVDYMNTDYGESQLYGHKCFFLGDMNGDGYGEFIVLIFNSPYPNECLPNYVQILSKGYTAIDDNVLPIPEVRLDCYPNPFRGAITVSLGKDGHPQRLIGLKVFDVKGRLVYEADSLSKDSFTWNGQDKHGNPVSSGIYVLQATDTNHKKHLAKIVRMK